MAATDVVVKFVADTNDLQNATKKLDSTGGKIKKWAKGVGLAIGGAFAVDFMKDSVAAAREAEEATKRLDAVFKAMGDTTGKASKEAQDYASTLSKQTAIEDETIMAAQAKLATFAAVSDETARAEGIFNRATAAAADLAADGFGSMDSTATQLGKALQDPVKGLAALGKSGVTFTASQKEQIKAMVASGDLLGAQKVLLGAVEGQVKGVAAATADGSDKMKLAFGEMQESVGGALTKILEKIAPVVTTIADWASKNTGWVAAIGAFVAVLWAINVALGANPIVLVMAAIAAFVGGLILAYNKVGWFKTAIDAFWAALKTVFGWIKTNWPLLLAILTGPIGMAVLLIKRNWDTMKSAAVSVYSWVRDKFEALVSFFAGIPGRIRALFDAIVRIIKLPINAAIEMLRWVQDKFNSLVAFLRGLPGRISDVMGNVVDAFKGPLNAVIRAWNRLGIPGFDFHQDMPFPLPDLDFHWNGVSLPNIPELAKGGIVKTPTLAMIGEAGPEAVVPLRDMRPSVVINVDARGVPDPYSVGAAIESRLRAWGSVSGRFHPGQQPV